MDKKLRIQSHWNPGPVVDDYDEISSFARHVTSWDLAPIKLMAGQEHVSWRPQEVNRSSSLMSRLPSSLHVNNWSGCDIRIDAIELDAPKPNEAIAFFKKKPLKTALYLIYWPWPTLILTAVLRHSASTRITAWWGLLPTSLVTGKALWFDPKQDLLANRSSFATHSQFNSETVFTLQHSKPITIPSDDLHGLEVKKITYGQIMNKIIRASEPILYLCSMGHSTLLYVSYGNKQFVLLGLRYLAKEKL